MNPEKEIVNLWLNRKGFFTINDINAGKRVIDIVAVRQSHVRHVEVFCSVSSRLISEKDKAELLEKFNSPNVLAAVKQVVPSQLQGDAEYEKVLVSTDNLSLEGVTVVPFKIVLAEVMRMLDKQYYKNSVVRTMQLMKYVLMSEASSLTPILVNDDKNKALTSQEKELMVMELLSQPSSLKIFKKKVNEQLVIELLKISTLHQPERLASALEQFLTPRSASRFMNVLLKQKNIQTAIKEEITKDQKLERFFT